MARVAVFDSGGRGEALREWFERYGHEVLVGPGNGGSAMEGKSMAVDLSDHDDIARVINDNRIEFSVIGPEAPLVAGVIDDLAEEGMEAFGFKRDAAMLEGSKIHCRRKHEEYGVPQPDFKAFDSGDHDKNVEAAILHANSRRHFGLRPHLVVKSDYLAGGKGVIVCDDQRQVVEALAEMKKWGPNFLLEERLVGREFSAIVMTDGQGGYKLFPYAQDNKPRFDPTEGHKKNPNTGGMGVVVDPHYMTGMLDKMIRSQMVERCLQGMRNDGTNCPGFLYMGGMIVGEGKDARVYSIEDNVRPGDPETEAQLPLIDADPFLLMKAANAGNISAAKYRIKGGSAVSIIIADRGYPAEAFTKGNEITIDPDLAERDNIFLFHAGTKYEDGILRSAGGRIMALTAIGNTKERARVAAYNALNSVHIADSDYRADIGRS